MIRVISKQEYMAIRGEYNFLYRYFIKSGGVNTGEQMFYTLLNDWMQSKGIDHRRGQTTIVRFLDRKFGHLV